MLEKKTDMMVCFKILKFSNRPSVFFPSNLLYIWISVISMFFNSCASFEPEKFRSLESVELIFCRSLMSISWKKFPFCKSNLCAPTIGENTQQQRSPPEKNESSCWRQLLFSAPQISNVA
jgi:hypothetical protein